MHPNIPNTIRETDTDLFRYGATMNFSCVEGTRFPDGMDLKTIICNELGDWDPPIEGSCQCELGYVTAMCT